MNYRTQYDLSYFVLLLRGTSYMSNDLILNINRVYNRVSRELKNFTW
jgi:hypothetical protein